MVADALLHPCSEEPPGMHIYGSTNQEPEVVTREGFDKK